MLGYFRIMTNHPLVTYFGNGPYCYANSTAMLLGSIGENISPATIEVLSGVGLGAALLGPSKLLFFSTFSGSPDRGLSQALTSLGFSFTERFYPDKNDDPFPALDKDLVTSPAVLGPLNMGYLDYNPRSSSLSGTDHYILAFGLGVHEAYLHDPAGFPSVSLFRDQLRKAWQAEDIGYRREYFRSWSNPKRTVSTNELGIFTATCEYFRQLYREDDRSAHEKGLITGKEAILTVAKKAQESELTELEVGHLTHFALPLASHRSLDFAEFFAPFDSKLTDLKRQQSEFSGRAHTLLMRRDFKEFSSKLTQIAEVEQAFRQAIG